MMGQINKYRIADLVLEVEGDPDYIAPEFKSFQCDVLEKTDIQICIKMQGMPELPDLNPMNWKFMGKFLIHENEDAVYQYFTEENPMAPRLAVIRDHFHKVEFYMSGDHKEEAVQSNIKICMQEIFFNAVLFEKGMSIHSASIIYKDKAVLFSAPSQTGKSTQTNMWNELLQAPILDGDATVCRVIDGKAFVYGLPWFGTSGLYMNQKAEIDSIVYLTQGKDNLVREINDPLEAFQRLFASSFSEAWNQEMLNKRIEAAEEILNYIKGYYFICRKEESAVWALKTVLDQRK